MSHTDHRETMPQPIQIVLLDVHVGDKRERRMLNHVIGKFLLRCFSCTYVAHHARLIVLVVDSRDNTQPHLSLLVDHVALRDSRALSTALRRLSLALKTSMKDTNYSNTTIDESDVFTLGYANLLLGAAADFISSISKAGTLAKSLCISATSSSGAVSHVHILTTEKLASVLSSSNAASSSAVMPGEVANKLFAHVNAIPYSSLSEEMLAYLLDDILGQSMRLHAQLVFPISPDGAPSGNVSLPLTLQPRLLITDSVPPAPVVRGMTSSMSSLGKGLSAGPTMVGPMPMRHASDPSCMQSPSADHQAYSAVSFMAASSVPSVRNHESAPPSGLESYPPQTLHILHSAPRLSVPQDVLYGLPFIGWGGTVTLSGQSPNPEHVESVPAHSVNSPDSPYEIDSRTDTVLSTLSDSERVLLCVSFDKDKMANCSYVILPSQQRSRPTMALIVQIAHAHTFLPMPSALLRCIHTQHTGAMSVGTNESAGLNTYSNNSGIEQSGSELQKDGTVTTPNFAENNGVENVISMLNNVPFQPFSPLDLSTLTSTSRPANDQTSTAHGRRVRFDDKVCVI